jgi:hypothetical protein
MLNLVEATIVEIETVTKERAKKFYVLFFVGGGGWGEKGERGMCEEHTGEKEEN